jgi:hypothetical protein
VKRIAFCFLFALTAAPVAVLSQAPAYSSNLPLADFGSSSGGGRGGVTSPISEPSPGIDRPFSRIAIGSGSSTLGINLTAATNLNRYMNLRATGSLFGYTMNNVTVSDFNVALKLNMASAGASLDLYPFPRHGFRVSPGLLFCNTSHGDGTFTSQPGSSFTLNNVTFYSSTTNPVQGSGSLGLHSQNPAFTITTGWGNIIPRRENKHLSFPFEIGVALIGSPAVNVALTSGLVCTAQGSQCTNVATDQIVQANLQEQVAKYRSDLDPLKTFPIISGGVAYSFRIR